jgi:integrase
MRKSNQYQLRWEDCDFARRELHLPRTKNGTSHIVPMIDDVYKALGELQKIQRQLHRMQAESGEPTERVRMVANGRVSTFPRTGRGGKMPYTKPRFAISRGMIFATPFVRASPRLAKV